MVGDFLFHHVCQVGIKQKMKFSFLRRDKTHALKRNTIAFELLWGLWANISADSFQKGR